MAEAYTGVKFKTLFEGVDFGYEKERKEIVAELARLGKRELLDSNNGNVSVKVSEGILITPSGKDMSQIKAKDLVLVGGIEEGARLVRTVGRTPPSSEAMMHWLIYEVFPRTKAVVHFHDAEILAKPGKFVETDAYHPYGTLELAYTALKALKKRKLIILKGHGVLVVGKDLKACHARVEKAVRSVR